MLLLSVCIYCSLCLSFVLFYMDLESEIKCIHSFYSSYGNNRDPMQMPQQLLGRAQMSCIRNNTGSSDLYAPEFRHIGG